MNIKEIFCKNKVVRIGSSVTCDPAPENGDIDYLIYEPKKLKEIETSLSLLGFEIESDPTYAFCTFNSWRHGNINCILTDDLRWFNRFLIASFVAKKLNLQEKKHRISICQFVRDDLADENFQDVLRLIEDEL